MRKWIALFMSWCLIMTFFSSTAYGAVSQREPSRLQQVQNETKQAVSAFNDLHGHWAYSAITHMAELKLLYGYANGDFRPNQKVTRAEFATVLHRIFGFTGAKANKFEDIAESAWYYDSTCKRFRNYPGKE